jgi:hypothetical protein
LYLLPRSKRIWGYTILHFFYSCNRAKIIKNDYEAFWGLNRHLSTARILKACISKSFLFKFKENTCVICNVSNSYNVLYFSHVTELDNKTVLNEKSSQIQAKVCTFNLSPSKCSPIWSLSGGEGKQTQTHITKQVCYIIQ